MPDDFGGIEVDEPSRDEFGGVAVQEAPQPRVTAPSAFDRVLQFMRPPPGTLFVGQNVTPQQITGVERAIVAPVQKGIEKGAEVAHEALAPAASEFLRRTGIDPSSTPERVVNLPRSTGTGIGAGLLNLGAGTAESLAQPENLVLLLGTAGEGNLARVASLTFATEQFAQLPEQVQNAIRVVADPKATRAQKTVALGQPIVSGILARAMVRQGLAPGREVSAAPRREAAPEIPSTEAVPLQAPAPSPQAAPQPPPPTPAPPVQAEAAAVPAPEVPPARPEIAKMGPAEAGANDMLGNPLGTQYYASPEDWAAWQQIQADKAAARQAGHPAALAQAFAKNEALKNKYGGSVPLPPKSTAEPLVTLYHGEGGAEGGGVDTRFFTKDPKRAASYGPNVTSVEVPKSVADAAEAERQKQGTGTSGDVILPDEWVKQAKPMAQPPAQPVIEIGEQPAAAAPAKPAKLTAAAFIPEGATKPVTGPNHPDILMQLGVPGFETAESRNTSQFGFVDENGVFHTREESAEIAKATGQDLKEFEPNEPAHSDEIESPTKPGVPISETKPSVAEPKAEGRTLEEVKRALPIGYDESTARIVNGLIIARQKPQYGGRWHAISIRRGTATPIHPPEGETIALPSETKASVPATKPAPPATPETAAAKAQTEVAKVAATEGQRPAAEVKSELVSRLQDAVKNAPTEFDAVSKAVTAKGATVSLNKEKFEAQKADVFKDIPKVTIDIPGDGVFTIPNTKEALSEVLSRAKKISTSPSEPVKVTKRGVSKKDKEWIQAQLAKGEAAAPPEPTPVGMGAAVPSEFALNPNTPTGIKNATVDAERQRRGLPPAIQPLRRAFGEVWDRAMTMIDHDPGMVDTLIDSLRDKPRALTDIEDAIVLHRQVDLQNEYGKATRDLAQAFEDGRTDAVAEEKLRVARLSDQLLDLYNIGKKVGTETGRGLAARRMMVNEDFSLAQMELETRAAKGGRPLTDAERQQVADLHARIADTERAYKEYRDAAEKRLVELETAKSIAELKASSAPRFDKRILAHAESIVSRMEAAAKPAADRLRERLSRMSAGVDPTIVTDAAIVGSAKIARLGLDLAKFTDEMIRDFGEKIRPMIADIWTEANRMIDAATSRVPDPVKQAIKKAATLTEVKEAATKDIAAKFAKGEKDKISWQVQRLARELVKSGVTDREQLIDQIHSLLQDAIPGITRREAMDAISGYGQFKQLTRDQISVTLRGMKGEMQQLAKLEDMAAGQPPLKTGLERRTPTEAERRLIKEVNDAKLKFQIPVSDPATQLRSALDTLKAGLRTRIADYEDRIARGDFAKRPRRNVELDPEAQRLKAQAEKVKQQFQRGVQLERLKNMGRVERTSDWVVKWRRGFLLSGPVTLAKLTSAAVQRLAITPAEELIGGAISRAIPQVASKAAREGGLNVRAEAQAITQGLTQGMRDAWQVLRTGQSDLDVLYGKAALVPPSVIDFFGHVHGALKAPVKRAEFARSFEKRSRAAINAGVDVSDPIVQSNLVIEAYKDANRSIFLQDNRVVTAYKRALAALEQSNRETGRVPLAGKAAATVARVLLPIVRVPTNIVAETMQYATGSVTGSARLARAFARGIETLKPEEADLIMRSLKKGSLGAAVMLLGYFNADVIGGYYQQGEKRKPGQPKAGTIDLYGYNIPSYLIHNPLIETLQIGATVRRVAESKISKKDQEEQGITTGVLAAGLGLTEEVPFVRETMETAKAFNPRERGAFFGELGKSLGVPQALQSWAAYQDKDWRGQPIQRQPRTVLQHVEMGIPGLRENVPVKRQTTTP